MLDSIWKKTLSKITIVPIIVIGAVLVIVIYLNGRDCNILVDIAGKFKTGKVTTEFRDYVTEMKGLQRLQAASLKTTDIFTRVDSRSILWDWIDLPDVKIEIKLPVEYTYYVDFRDKWNFEWDENLMHIKVIAPKIKPNTPAVNISEMSVNILKGSFLRDVDEVKDSLFKELMPRLVQLSYEKIPLVKETARKEISEFVSGWLIQIYFKDYKLKPELISVYFEDETNQTGTSQSIKVDKGLQ